MARNDYHIVEEARTSRHGLMVCSACGKAIDQGPYRYRDAGDKYVTQHRMCSLSDPKWERWDTQVALNKLANIALLDAAKAFRDEWKIDDLDDLIASLEKSYE